MELWIRTQDKKRLLKIDDISIVDYNGYYYVAGYKDGREIKLGEYGFHISTRALEVLDEIQNILKPQLIVKEKEDLEIHNFKFELVKIPQLEYDIEQMDTYVYEMPKE